MPVSRTEQHALEFLRVVPVLVLLTAVAIVAVAAWRRRHGAPPRAAWITSGLDCAVGLSIAVIITATLVVGRQPWRTVALVPFGSIHYYLVRTSLGTAAANLLGNVVLLVPIGFLAPIRWPWFDRWERVAGCAAAFSATIEVIQFFIGGRTSSVDDVILNVSGAVLGYWLCLAGRRMLRSRGAPVATH